MSKGSGGSVVLVAKCDSSWSYMGESVRRLLVTGLPRPACVVFVVVVPKSSSCEIVRADIVT